MSLLLVGQAPSSDTNGRAPFSGRSGRRLAELMGMTHEEFLDRVPATNVLPCYPGKSRGAKGDAFPMNQAVASARTMEFGDAKLVVLVGKNVARAFGRKDHDYFEEFELRGRRAVIIPHPSGVNRWWNEPVNVETARLFMTEVTECVA